MEKLLLVMSMSVSCLAQLSPSVPNRNLASFFAKGMECKRPPQTCMSWTTRGKGLGGQDEHRKPSASLTGEELGATLLFCQIQRRKK